MALTCGTVSVTGRKSTDPASGGAQGRWLRESFASHLGPRLRSVGHRAAVQIVGLASPANTKPRSANAFRMRGVFESAMPVVFATA
jgi:hypothetical protein